MDTLFLYRLVEAVQDSLDRAGREGFSAWRAEGPDSWFDFDDLSVFLNLNGAESVPILWEGRALPELRTLRVLADGYHRKACHVHLSGRIRLLKDALVAPLVMMIRDGLPATCLVVGERRAGALQELLDAYGAFARANARESSWIRVVGGNDLPRPTDLDWDDLLVPPAVRDDLRVQVDAFFGAAAEYARLGLPHRRGILLAGPPGNGKTTAIRIIAARRPDPFFLFALKPDTEGYEMDEAFGRASFDAPSILCFEDVDSLFGEKMPLSHFLNRLDGLRPFEGVLVLATTNHPEKLDEAITERPSRFDRVFTFGNPQEPERRLYLSRALGAAFDERLVDDTAGFSVAQLKEVRVSACLEAVAQGLSSPTLEAARRAIARLRGQKESLDAGWEDSRAIGFAPSRARNSRLRDP